MLLRSLLYSSENEIKNNLQKTKCILGQEFLDEKTSIRIRCMWDSIINHHDIAEPMYKTWEHDGYGKKKLKFYIRIYRLFLDGGHTPVANALITDEQSTVKGR